jgi:hypothetical protein
MHNQGVAAAMQIKRLIAPTADTSILQGDVEVTQPSSPTAGCSLPLLP